NGNVWAARHDRKVSYTSPTGKKVIVAESYNGHKLNSPNDIVIAQDGSVWFTDPPFGIQGYGPSKAEEEQPVRGIYQFENGSVVLRNGALKLPNGIAFSPDASALFVADTADGYVYRFDVNQGALKNRRKFAIVDPGASKAKLEPTVDGLDVDSKGNLFVAGPGGLGVFSKDGTQIGYYPIDASHISNVAVGGPNGDQLLVTASNKVFLFEIY
ncbi:MAG: SMP-30/gluconolactonase/LRE family protein, partial [Myxococcota bacterium]